MMKIFQKIMLLGFCSALLLCKPVSANEDILTIGDSLTAGLAGLSNGTITCAALGGAVVAANNQRSCKGNGQRNVGGWQPGLAALAAVDVFNYGNSGELTSEMLSRLNNHMSARSSRFVLILGGTNDAIRGPSVATVVSNLISMIQAVKNAGRTPIIGTLPPLLGGRFANSNNKVLAINAEIRKLGDIEIADHYSALIANWADNTSGDFIHLGPNGNTKVAATWAQAINRSLTPPQTKPVIAPLINLIL